MVRLNLYRESILPDILVAAISESSNVSCFGENDGWAKVSALGGDMNYSFAWSNGQTDATAIGLPVGTYTVTVTDGTTPIPNTATASVTILDDNTQIVATSTIESTLCGGSDGSILLSVNGGVSPYTYSWNNGDTGILLDSLTGGSYTCIITDANGCVSNNQLYIVLSEGLSVSYSVTQPSYYSGSDGSIDVTVSGGTPPYSYLWSDSSTTEDIVGVSSGWYYLTVSDSLACTGNTLVYVTQDVPDCAGIGVSGTVTSIGVSCNDSNNGMAIITATTSYPPFVQEWSNGQVSDTVTGLSAGPISILLVDSAGCFVNLQTTITEPDAISISGTATNETADTANDGSIDITVVGGSGSLSYLWSNDSITEDIAMLDSNWYVVVVTDSLGCMDSANFFVSTLDTTCLLSVNVDSLVDASCFGESNGLLAVSPVSGTAPYSYLWGGGQTTDAISGLSAGNYTVVLSDSTCDTQFTIPVLQPAKLVISGIISNASWSNADGSVNITVTGGNSGNTFEWSNSATSEDLSDVPGDSYYFVTVTDTLFCVASTIFYIGENAANCADSGVTAPVNTTNVSCNGGSNGSAIISASSSYLPLSYEWSNNETTDAITGLSIGNYFALVTDAAGCIMSVSATITEPSSILISNIAITDATFGDANGAIDIDVSGGTQMSSSPYSYLWSNFATTQDISAVNGNVSYTVTVTDSLGCPKSATYLVPEVIDCELYGVTGVITANNVKCFGSNTGSALVDASGDYSPFTYAWSNGSTNAAANNLSVGNYSVVITDAAGCIMSVSATITEPSSILISNIAITDATFGDANGAIDIGVSGGTQMSSSPYSYLWSNFATTQDISAINGNVSYTVTVTDSLGCTMSATYFVPEIIDCELSGVSGAITANDAKCFGSNTGSALVDASGDYFPFTYAWSNGSTNISANNLSIGNYTVVITDSAGCQSTLFAAIGQPSSIVITSEGTINTSFGEVDGIINVAVSGGTPSYSYLWSNYTSVEDATGLSTGLYVLTVTDSMGCTKTFSALISESDPICDISGTVDITSISCFGATDGGLLINATSSYPPVAYLWDDATTHNLIENFGQGSHNVVLSDSANCVDTVYASILGPDAAVSVVQDSIANPLCSGDLSGYAAVVASGGYGNYGYDWSNAETSEAISGIAAGTYTVTITDNGICPVSINVTITEPDVLVASVDADSTDRAINLTVTGGTSPFSYSWDNNETTEDLDSLDTGTYSVIVTDNNGCTATASQSAVGGISQINFASLINIYPNPTRGTLSITNAVNSTIQLYDVLGNVILSKNNTLNVTQLDISNLKNGTYYIKISNDKFSIAKKVYLIRE